MLTLPSDMQEYLQRENRRLTVCAVIYKNDGSVIRCTQHDDDLRIAAGDFEGVYFSVAAISASDVKSTSDLSVSNLEVSGFIQRDIAVTGFTVEDIKAGLFSNAPYETFMCRWDNPNAWQKPVSRGYLGDISRTAEGSFQCEWRGITNVLHQQIGRTYGERCDVKRFGDARCKLDVDAMVVAGTVTAVTSRRRFDATLSGGPYPLGRFDLGELTFATGANAGYLKQVKRDAVSGTSGQFDLWESLPNAVQIGDEFSARPGCDRRWETCKDTYGNQINFRGHGRWIPGLPAIVRAP